ncbi:glycosyltransferase [Rhizobium rhizogenes]|uniref:glycosyltransferase n=1 Tax=Rhizobium rhizogenes TaxID=359 RepID=UPI00157401BD|nr:glycosyltransferase [Rhizobium rhizogenes]NTF65759.1 glycosyltransferase [Rhizobium rhizogenes]NTG97111.1 glycosyltransferase [Rhizobium rhizogenes]
MKFEHKFRSQSQYLASIIVPTFNRAFLLDATLRSLTKQDIDPADYEVVVCDDGSTDNSYELFKSIAIGPYAHWKYVFYPDRGYHPTRARNMGIRLAEGRLSIFLDCGNLATSALVRGHVEATGDAPKAVIGYIYNYGDNGVYDDESITIIDTNDIDKTVADISTRTSRLLYDTRERFYGPCENDISRYALDWGLYWTGNCSAPTAAAISVGGFDEQLTSWGCDDTDFGLALKTAGIQFTLSRKAAAVQYPHEKDYSKRRISAAANSVIRFNNFPRPDTKALANGGDLEAMILGSLSEAPRSPAGTG